MAQLNEAFDATTVDPSTGSGNAYPVHPADRYLAEIVRSDLLPTKSGEGQFIWLEFGICDGPLTGEMFETRINIVNPNPTAEKIGKETLSAICHAVGEMSVSDTEVLHFKPMLVTLKVVPEGPDKKRTKNDAGELNIWPAKNEVGKYEALDSSAKPAGTAAKPPQAAARPAQAAAKPAAAPAAQPAATGSKAPPWRR